MMLPLYKRGKVCPSSNQMIRPELNPACLPDNSLVLWSNAIRGAFRFDNEYLQVIIVAMREEVNAPCKFHFPTVSGVTGGSLPLSRVAFVYLTHNNNNYNKYLRWRW